MKRKYDAVYTEKYTDKDGTEKKKYTNVGTVLEREDGTLCMKFLGSWVNFYEPKSDAPQKPARDYKTTPAVSGADVYDDFEDSPPF